MNKHYAKEGYFVFKNKANKELINKIINEFRSVLIEQLTLNQIRYTEDMNLQYYMRLLATNNISAYFSCIKVAEAFYSMYELMVSSDIKMICESAGFNSISMPVRPAFHIVDHVVSELVHKQKGFHELPQHQDWSALQSSIDSLVFWIPTMDINENVPGIELAPKTHLLGHLPTKNHQFGHTIDDSFQISDEQFIKPKLNRGDILAFSSFLVHRSESSLKFSRDASRIALSFRASNVSDIEYASRNYHKSHKTTVEYNHGQSLVSPQKIKDKMADYAL